MPPSGIGDRIRSWLRSFGFWVFIDTKLKEYQARNKQMMSELVSGLERSLEAGDLKGVAMYALLWIWYIFGGGSIWLPANIRSFQETTLGELEQFQANPQAWMQAKLREFGTSSETKAYTEFIGTIITEPVVSLLETYASDPNPDPHAMARSFHGIASGLPWASGVIDSILKSLLGDRAPEVGKHVMSLYWGLGLGFLGWQTLAPLLSSGLQPNLERYYNKLYRPERFSAAQMGDLFALGKVTANEVRETLREGGWRDSDVQKWLDLAYRSLPEGVIWDLYHTGKIDQAEVEKRLRVLGFNPADIPLLFLANPKEDEPDALRYTLSTAKNALKNHLIGEGEFRSILSELRYQPREIDLQYQLATTQREEETRELNTAQIERLYKARVIGKDEAGHFLSELRYASDVVAKLIGLWDAQTIPKAVRLNRSTIMEGYVNGVLSRDQAKGKLRTETGYSSEQAELIVKIEEAGIQKREAAAKTQGPAVSLSMLGQFVTAGLITRSEVEARSELDRFSTEDKGRIIDLMFLEPAVKQVTLSERILLDAYVFGLLSREQVAERLSVFGLTAEDIELLIQVEEAANPAVFAPVEQTFLQPASPGALQLAFQRGLITEQQFRDRLASLGYSPDAIEIYLFNAQYQTPAEPRELAKSDIIRLYRLAKISRQNALARLIRQGYTIDDAGLLIEAEELTPADTEVGQAFIAGLIDVFGAGQALTELGFGPDQIEEFFTAAFAGEV